MPSEERVFAHYGRDLTGDRSEAFRSDRRMSWFEHAAERAERRSSVSYAADRTHREIWNDFTDVYGEVYEGPGGKRQVLQRRHESYGANWGDVTAPFRCLEKTGKGSEETGGWKDVRFKLEGEMDGEVPTWHKSKPRRHAEGTAFERVMQKLEGRWTDDIDIRMRGGKGGEKTLVRRRKGREVKSKPKPSRLLGGYGEVNDVEWQDVWRTYEKGSKKERWVRFRRRSKI